MGHPRSRRLRCSLWFLVGLSALSGCHGAAPTDTGSDSAALSPKNPNASPVTSAPIVAAPIPLYEITFDPKTLASSVHFLPPRGASAQPPQALTYDLDIEQFLNGDSFDLSGLTTDPDGDFVFSFTHSHPFPAPDFTKPVSGLNRADLGYTGRLLILADKTSQGFFGNTITLDPTLVANPDGYVNPGDLLSGSGFTNNTFPFVLLADDGQDNRIGVSNGGASSGNYHTVAGGWQQSTIGVDGTGWTGFDFIHGGQTIENHFTIRADALASGQVSFAVAFLIKYTDPRGVGGKVARLPQEPADPLQFAYRLPFAALDCSQVVDASTDHTMDIAQGDTMHVQLAIRDWDDIANEAADANLSDEPDTTRVPPGTTGLPVIEVDAPQISATSQTLPTVDGGVGEPGAELMMSGDLSNVLGTAAAGDVLALVRVTDPEDLTDDSAGYHYGVDPVTIAPSALRALTLRTYQLLPFKLVDILSCPSQTMTFDFDDGTYQGWLLGGYGTGNGDQAGWGGFSLGCQIPAAEADLPGLSGNYLTTGNDDNGSATLCDFSEDYGPGADYNIVSPILVIPELCGADQVLLNVSGGLWTRTGAKFEVYTSTDAGDNWILQNTINDTGASQSFDNIEIALTGITSDDHVLIRLRFEDDNGAAYEPTGQDYVGLFLDAITVSVGSLDPITIKSDAACRIWDEDFEGSTAGWVEYGLPETDAAIAEGSACGIPGPWGGPAICDLFLPAGQATGRALTFGADDGLCGEYDADLAHSSNFNFVSPPINLTTAPAGSELRFDEITGSFIGQPVWTTTIYAAINPMSGDPGAGNWGAPLITFVHEDGEPVGSTLLSAALPPALIGAANVRLRIQVTTPPNTTGYSECPGAQNICECGLALSYSDALAIGVDNLRIGDFTSCD